MNSMRLTIHPGEVLKDELAKIGMTTNACPVPAYRITAILKQIKVSSDRRFGDTERTCRRREKYHEKRICQFQFS